MVRWPGLTGLKHLAESPDKPEQNWLMDQIDRQAVAPRPC